jgi:predicted dinucleotide-binding enzyme
LSADLIALAVPWPHCLGVVASVGPLRGKILIDCTNPEAPDGRSLEIGHTTSGAEQIARIAPEAYVVKAFNALYAGILDGETRFEATPSVLFCGDDPRARDCVARVIATCGFDPVDAGPLVNARLLEPLAILTVQLVRVQGWGPSGMAWRIARPLPVEQEAV